MEGWKDGKKATSCDGPCDHSPKHRRKKMKRGTKNKKERIANGEWYLKKREDHLESKGKRRKKTEGKGKRDSQFADGLGAARKYYILFCKSLHGSDMLKKYSIHTAVTYLVSDMGIMMNATTRSLVLTPPRCNLSRTPPIFSLSHTDRCRRSLFSSRHLPSQRLGILNLIPVLA